MSGIIERFIRRGGVTAAGLALMGEPGRDALKKGAAVAVVSEVIDVVAGTGCGCSSMTPRQWLDAVTAEAQRLAPELVARDGLVAPLGDRGHELAAALLSHVAKAPVDAAQAIVFFDARGIDRWDLQRAAAAVRAALEDAIRTRALQART